MNVAQITADSSNPSIWLFFVGTVGLNLLIAFTLALANWIHIKRTHNRTPGILEFLGFAVGQ
jgi:hypothetical protein